MLSNLTEPQAFLRIRDQLVSHLGLRTANVLTELVARGPLQDPDDAARVFCTGEALAYNMALSVESALVCMPLHMARDVMIMMRDETGDFGAYDAADRPLFDDGGCPYFTPIHQGMRNMSEKAGVK